MKENLQREAKPTKSLNRELWFSVYFQREQDEQDRIHGKTVADGWAGAVLRKPLAIQNIWNGWTDGRAEGPTQKVLSYSYLYEITSPKHLTD